MARLRTVVLFLVDGLRPDGMQQADTPVMDNLVASGVHTLDGRTVAPSVTLPCHMSLFLGVDPGRHGITTNTWTPQARPVPGLIEVLRASGGQAASFYNWEQLRDISRPGSLQASFFLSNCHDAGGSGDRELAALATSWLSKNEVDFAFVYLGYADIAGHGYGWMSEPYLEGIANADRCIGQVIGVLPADSTIIVTSDHGGHDHTHGTDCDEDMTIPLIISGAGIPAGQPIGRQVAITDIAPTAAGLLGLAAPPEWTGRAIEFAPPTGGPGPVSSPSLNRLTRRVQK